MTGIAPGPANPARPVPHPGPAYLEAATVRTRRLYTRYGYVVRSDAPIQLPGDGPLMCAMWRELYQHPLKQPVLP
jgi:hypothetical protein